MRQANLFQNVSLSVSDVTRYIRQVFESDEILQDLWISGEISNLSKPSSGHIYFTLKEAQSGIKCVIWRTTALRIRTPMQNGMAVEAHGTVSIYERDGTYQLYVDQIRAAGEGVLYLEFLRLRDRLSEEGLFDDERKRPLPERPKVIGIITSPTGAALQDMLNTLRNRYPLARVVLAPVPVQGDEAPPAIAAAIKALNQQVQPDVIILARGGGSLEDLWAFNDERVVRAVAGSSAPTVTGVGHETDFTLADFAADLRAPTPTGAAVATTPDKNTLLSELAEFQNALRQTMVSNLYTCNAELDNLRTRLRAESPVRKIRSSRQYLDAIEQRIQSGFSTHLSYRKMAVGTFRSQLSALNPYAVLQRGYALVNKPDSTRINSVSQVNIDDSVVVHVSDGSFTADVDKIMTGRPGQEDRR